MKQRPPDYKGIADSVSENMQGLSTIMGDIIGDFKKFKEDEKVPQAIRTYMGDSLPQYEAIKKQADDLVAQAKGLGELKLDTLRDALRQKNPILVRGETEWRVLAYDKVWRIDDRDIRSMAEKGAFRRRFAGEQMITTAILALNHPQKLKVCFIRAGGQPVTEAHGVMMGQGGPMLRPGGPFSSVADRLREYNFDVSEKDVTNMWAMESRGQGPPEPSMDDIKDAVWVVLAFPMMEQGPQGTPPPTVGSKVIEHLENGGSALIITMPHGEDLAPVLKNWGIEVRNDAICVHDLITTEGAQQGMVEEAKKNPFIFEVRDGGIT